MNKTVILSGADRVQLVLFKRANAILLPQDEDEERYFLSLLRRGILERRKSWGYRLTAFGKEVRRISNSEFSK